MQIKNAENSNAKPEELKSFIKSLESKFGWSSWNYWKSPVRGFYKEKLFVIILDCQEWFDRSGGTEHSSLIRAYDEQFKEIAETEKSVYRDRIDDRRDNYNNKYQEIIDVIVKGEEIVVKVTTYEGNERQISLVPKRKSPNKTE